MGNIMIGRCYVECWVDQDYTRPAITINFLNRKQAESFSYHWTKRNGFLHVFMNFRNQITIMVTNMDTIGLFHIEKGILWQLMIITIMSA